MRACFESGLGLGLAGVIAARQWYDFVSLGIACAVSSGLLGTHRAVKHARTAVDKARIRHFLHHLLHFFHHCLHIF